MRRFISRRSFASAFGTLPFFAAHAYGADSWQTRKPAEWDAKQIDKILSDSPWAKRVTVTLNASGAPGGGRGGRGGGGVGELPSSEPGAVGTGKRGGRGGGAG